MTTTDSRPDKTSVARPNAWFGFGFALLYLLVEFIDPETAASGSMTLLFVAIAGYLYWFYFVYRLHRVIQTTSGYQHPISPLAAVGCHFIPLYGLFWLFRWPNAIADFVNYHSLTNGKVARMAYGWPGFLLLLGSLGSRFDSAIGLAILFSVGVFLSHKVGQVLDATASEEAHESSQHQTSLTRNEIRTMVTSGRR